ncbi:MAG: TfoX/Sxy family protein [Actinomycetota bacterium]|nr:TfoX/Sxy family protein [Actinomycetota bacterium]
MPFQKSPPDLVARFDVLACLVPGGSRKLMFGFPSVVLGGHMFMGLFEDHLILRLGDDDRAALLGMGGEVFEPMAGRPMKDYVVVPEALVGDTDAMGEWVERSVAYAQSLPPKKSKPSKGAKASKPSNPTKGA